MSEEPLNRSREAIENAREAVDQAMEAIGERREPNPVEERATEAPGGPQRVDAAGPDSDAGDARDVVQQDGVSEDVDRQDGSR